MASAYLRAEAQRLAQHQHQQRAMAPKKVAQKLLREYCGRHGFGGVMDVGSAALLVQMVEAIIVAERAPSPSPPPIPEG